MTFSVALTGGIASGKSATAQRFAQLGVAVLDADAIARELVAPGQPALAQIATAFGDDVVNAAGELNRQRLRERVFANLQDRRRLESILHPRIHQALLTEVQHCTMHYCILAIPLLIECWQDYLWVDRVLVTDIPRDLQIARLTQRDKIDLELAERMLQAQASRELRLTKANDVIDNTGPINGLDAIVSRLHRYYLDRAAEKGQA